MDERGGGGDAAFGDGSKEVGLGFDGRRCFTRLQVEECQGGPGSVGEGHQVAAVEHAADPALVGLPVGRGDNPVGTRLHSIDGHGVGQRHLRSELLGE